MMANGSTLLMYHLFWVILFHAFCWETYIVFANT